MQPNIGAVVAVVPLPRMALVHCLQRHSGALHSVPTPTPRCKIEAKEVIVGWAGGFCKSGTCHD
eukprot:1668862-Pleurochrysis_carterae.AAC.1